MNEEAPTASELSELWSRDAKIDKTELGDESLRVEQLHAQWWKHLLSTRRRVRSLEGELKKLRVDKYVHYTQGPSRETLPRGWRLPPQGRVLKNEAGAYVDADVDVLALSEQVAQAQDALDVVVDALKMIAARGYRITAAIDWQKFTQGR